MTKEQFAERLSKLRINKGVSARDMSLSIGQSAGYINNIENGVNLPSMTFSFISANTSIYHLWISLIWILQTLPSHQSF